MIFENIADVETFIFADYKPKGIAKFVNQTHPTKILKIRALFSFFEISF